MGYGKFSLYVLFESQAESYVRKIIERSYKAFTQRAKLAVLSVGITLELLKLTREDGLKEGIEIGSILRTALRLARENRKAVLLYHHNPWTDTVVAQTETFYALRKILASKRSVRIVTTLKHLGSVRA